MSKKSTRAALAQETLEIIRTGQDRVPDGRTVSIHEMLDQCLLGTRLVLPDEVIPVDRMDEMSSASPLNVEVTAETTLAAARRLAHAGGHVLVLNFASARNAGGVRTNQPHDLERLPEVFAARTRRVLALAAALGADSLILAAWGCGVFQNDPEMVARIFAKALAEPAAHALRRCRITFAIYDNSSSQAVPRAFQNSFVAGTTAP